MIERSIVQVIQPTVNEMAREFCEMDDEQQVRFFNEIGRIVREEWNKSFAFQMQYIIDNKELNDDGKVILNTIKDYME